MFRPCLALALVTVLQFGENLTDRQAADAVRLRLDWQYALGLGMDDPGFDHSVLSEFRARVAGYGAEERVLDLLLAQLQAKGLIKAGGKQRTDSTHVICAVRELNRLELAGESVRAAAEALAAAAGDWLASVIDVAGWNRRYGARVDSWRLPASATKKAELGVAYGTDAVLLLRAVYAADTPAWIRQVPAVQVLRTVLVQNYLISTDRHGREVIRMREAEDGLPPGRYRLISPYDRDARCGVKRGTAWNGYKVHVSETCSAPGQPPPVPEPGAPAYRGQQLPNIITNVATTDATVPDNQMTATIHDQLAGRGLSPGEHCLDSGYPTPELIISARDDHRITLISPLLADNSPQAKAAAGFDRTAFSIDYDAQQITCPQGKTSSSWTPGRQRSGKTIAVKFRTADCAPCPVRHLCTTSAKGRQLTIRPRQIQQALDTARKQQQDKTWQAKYALRAGVEGTIGQAVAVTGIRHARYRTLAKVSLEHVYSAVALNLIRLDAWWNGHPLDRKRTSHLARLELDITA